ncbi:MAG: HAD hydrolase family protein [Promethearchaeota archaeon]
MKKLCVCWDLEGPISILDFAAELGKKLSYKSQLNLRKYNMGDFFKMISNYDDYIIDSQGIKEKLNIPEYQPGDTLRIMAPLYIASYTDKELINLARNNLGLLPGCKELMKILHKKWDIYVISTSYCHFAHTVTAALNIQKDHVYCTNFNIEKLIENFNDIKNSIDILIPNIFQKYIDHNKDLNFVIDDLNNFFWKDKDSDYIKLMNKVKVRGGKRKEIAVEEISKRTGVNISEMIALGDSITDINMLQRLKDENGIAISFNGNKFSLKKANVAVTSPNSLGTLPIFQYRRNLYDFLEKWELKYEHFKHDPKKIPNELISNESKYYFIKYDFVPDLRDLTNKSKDQIEKIISNQERMRKNVRGWGGTLG